MFTQTTINLFHKIFPNTDDYKRVHWTLSVKERQSRNSMLSTIRFDVYLIKVQVVGFQGRLSVLTEPLYYPFTAPFSTATRISSLLCTRLMFRIKHRFRLNSVWYFIKQNIFGLFEAKLESLS